MITAQEFAQRRKRLNKQIGSNGIAILPAARSAIRSNDTEYHFRQNSDFYYLTGFSEPEAVLVLLPNRKDGEYILFNRPKNPEREIWEGRFAGQKGACKTYRADQAFSIHDFEKMLPELLEGREQIHYTLGINPDFDKVVLNGVNVIRRKIRSGAVAPMAFLNITQAIHELRLIKSPAEIQLMRTAAQISAHAHMRAMQTCSPGWYEYHLEAEISHEFQQQGARFTAYNSIVGSGANSCILHYIDNTDVLVDGDLVLIDAGCEYQYYAADITRTFPVNGIFSPEQRAVYEIVLAAQTAGIQSIKPNVSWPKVEEITIKILTQGLKDLGLLKGSLDELIEKQAYFKFYMHRCGHFLGMDVHDAGTYKVDGKWRKLAPGMVRTVEPGLYISADIPGVPKKWHNIGVRIEDDILVTKTGYEILSADAPKTISGIEALMS